MTRLGIAITTFNRRVMVIEQIARIRALTTMPFELVVCDDGSWDGTREALRAEGERVIGGIQRGIAWNKNRGLFYLLNVVNCDVILLLDDDVVPVTSGWEREWVEAARRWGHVNALHPYDRAALAGGGLTAAEPGLSGAIPGWALVFSRIALAAIGYFDRRFGRYGHEHTDFTYRAIRAGFGGITSVRDGADVTLFYVIEGGLEGVPSDSAGTAADLEAADKFLGPLKQDQIYRHAWRDDTEMGDFLAELVPAVPALATGFGQHPQVGAPEAPNSVKLFRQFDLGVLRTLGKIHVLQPWRLNGFVLSVSIDGTVWVDLIEVTERVAPSEKYFAWSGPGTAFGRFVRVTPSGHADFRDGQIEVFGPA